MIMEKKVFKVLIEKKLTLNNIDDVIICAIEGGSNYWYVLDQRAVVEPKDFKRNESIHYPFLDKVYQGSSVDINDAEDSKEKLGTLNIESIERGLKLLGTNHAKVLNNIIEEIYDANDADIFFQLCVLGEIVYG